jgi:hypothetical protein
MVSEARIGGELYILTSDSRLLTPSIENARSPIYKKNRASRSSPMI